MLDNKLKNYNIRMLYSVGFASLMLSQYKTNLTFGFAPYEGKDNKGIDRYDSKMFISISVSYAEAAALYHISDAIVEGYNKPGEFVNVIKIRPDGSKERGVERHPAFLMRNICENQEKKSRKVLK